MTKTKQRTRLLKIRTRQSWIQDGRIYRAGDVVALSEDEFRTAVAASVGYEVPLPPGAAPSEGEPVPEA
jgi:hypothetical protein